MSRARIVLILLAFLPTAVLAAIPKYQYLIDATNKLVLLSSVDVRIKPEAAKGALSASCTALRRLLTEPSLDSDLARLQNGADLKRLLSLERLDNFLAVFITTEQTTLRQAGLNDEAINRVMVGAGMYRFSLATTHDPGALKNGISALAAEICNGTATLTRANGEEREQLLERWKYRLLGTGVAVANIAIAAGGVEPAILSVHLGMELLTLRDK